jgi:hypothetical protein
MVLHSLSSVEGSQLSFVNQKRDHYITLHYSTLHYITLHFITTHLSMPTLERPCEKLNVLVQLNSEGAIKCARWLENNLIGYWTFLFQMVQDSLSSVDVCGKQQ